MKILLINPANEHDIDREVLRELEFLGDEAFFAPHACAVVAALTPREHEVTIHDEQIHGPAEAILAAEKFDIVGISLIGNAYQRAMAIAEGFRASEQPGVLVAGGACVLHMVAELRELVDVAFVGEAEETWPRFLEEYQAGRHSTLYRQIAKPDLSGMPVPRWDLVGEDLSRYSVAAIQTVRGCPHDCAFCDVIYIYGRKLRFKPIDQVIEEIEQLERLGAEMIFFADDNFAASRKHTKEVLRRIIELNATFDSQLSFATQVDITIADDEELLQLLLDANFLNVQIGIESVNPESLEDLHKLHNLRFDLVEAVRKIQSYGIVVLAHMIIGVDSDDESAFERTAGFLDEANVIHQACHPLMAPPGTKLWYQLRREGRLVKVSPEMQDRMDPYTNVVPRRMTRVALIEGLIEHRLRVSEPAAFLERARGFARGVEHRPEVSQKNQPSFWSRRKTIMGMTSYYTFKAPKAERRVFFTLLKEFGRRADLMPRLFYALICHAMERRQAEIKAGWARGIVEEERSLPDGPATMSRAVVIAPAIRQSFVEIAAAAYARVRPELSDREALYEVVVEALCDYATSFGETFETFDDYQRDALEKSCARVLGSAPRGEGAAGEMPEEGPPPGFAREVLDAVDQTMRFGLG